MSERRRRRKRQSSRKEAFWITAGIALVLAGGFLWLVVSAAYTGSTRRPTTDSSLKGPVLTLPNTNIPATNTDSAVPIIVTEPDRGAGAQKNADDERGLFAPNWIEEIGAAGILGLVLVLGLSTIGLWMQVRLLVKSAERQYRDVERAFLHIAVEDAQDAIARDGAPVVRIEIRCLNNGVTPTRYGLSHVSWHHFRDGGPDAISFKDLWEHEQGDPARLAVGPKGAVILDVLEIPESELLKSPGCVFVWGWADYNDVFEDSLRHRTEFCFAIERIKHGNAMQTRYRTYRQHNGYDDECYRVPALYAMSRG
jgi:hypothetical protein